MNAFEVELNDKIKNLDAKFEQLKTLVMANTVLHIARFGDAVTKDGTFEQQVRFRFAEIFIEKSGPGMCDTSSVDYYVNYVMNGRK